VPLYIDDLLITWSNKELIDKFKEKNDGYLWNDKPWKNDIFSWHADISKTKWDIPMSS
jgi:hypothetical protein